MSHEEILDGLTRIARQKLEVAVELEGEMRLVEDLGLDSIRLLTLATEVEDHFRICLDEDDEAGIVTVDDLVAAIRGKLPG